jgi:hypothetical protein
MSRTARTRLARLTMGVLALAVTITAGAAAPAAAGDVGVQGLYLLNSRYTGDPNATRGWQIEWQVPQLSNPADSWGAVGQWYFNLESGFYKSPDGWGVYSVGDGNGLSGHQPDCAQTWDSGGVCGGDLGNLQPGQTLTFTYQWCDTAHNPSTTGSQLCLWVDMQDGQGNRFLAEDARSTVEMYAHDIETFADSGPAYPEPLVSCAVPTRMLGQRVQNAAGAWSVMTGASTWNFEDGSDRYQYINTQTGSSPATWESCSQ